ncbi:MAG: hypothetical protein QG552_676 [Thermodesulfobacteriota bacterium]|nr:hypothetical protein [Thermodesulfobacteriota bacterium]
MIIAQEFIRLVFSSRRFWVPWASIVDFIFDIGSIHVNEKVVNDQGTQPRWLINERPKMAIFPNEWMVMGAMRFFSTS